jgi:hypothetical protein
MHVPELNRLELFKQAWYFFYGGFDKPHIIETALDKSAF